MCTNKTHQIQYLGETFSLVVSEENMRAKENPISFLELQKGFLIFHEMFHVRGCCQTADALWEILQIVSIDLSAVRLVVQPQAMTPKPKSILGSAIVYEFSLFFQSNNA